MVVILGAVLVGGESPQTRAAIFMSALARGDAEALTDSTYLGGRDRAAMKAAWERTVREAEFYRFRYRILGAQNSSADTAAVRMHVWRNYGPMSFEENFQLDLKKVEGRWKVRPEGISRAMFPFLPRL